MEVSIKEPCHENWGKMSPTDRGAFCQKCAIDVHDFSDKSANEIKQVLKANIGKHLCGRFTKNQLTDLSISYQNWNKQSVSTFRSKFLWACMLAFGMTLFSSCGSSTAQEVTSNLIEHVDIDTNKTKTDTVKSIESIPVDNEFEYLLGDIDYYEPEIEMLKGEIAIIDEQVDLPPTCSSNDSLKNSTDSTKTPPIQLDKLEPIIMGKIAPPDNFNDFLNEPPVHIEDIPSEIKNDALSALVFPNPAVNKTVLKISPQVRDFYTVNLWTVDGQLISTLYSGYLSSETKLFDIDLTGYATGVYLIKISTNQNSSTIKFNKISQ